MGGLWKRRLKRAKPSQGKCGASGFGYERRVAVFSPDMKRRTFAFVMPDLACPTRDLPRQLQWYGSEP